MASLAADYTCLALVWCLVVGLFGLGVLWAFPLKSVFKGVGQADPDQRD